MSEYWKSTPKYWCKFCKTYVKDTKFEKQQHEATGRHKGNVQRSINQLHREHEKEDREKQRAKDEVARLNAVVSGQPPPPRSSYQKPGTTSKAAQEKKGDPEERKRHINQLASMGVSIPEEDRRDMAMAGEWQTVSVRRVEPDDDDKKDIKPDILNIGVHKRKLEKDEQDEDEDEEAFSTKTKKAKPWGPRSQGASLTNEDNVDFDALMGNKDTKAEPATQATQDTEQANSVSADADSVVKKEEEESEVGQAMSKITSETSAPVLFKKRKKTAAG